MCWRGAVLKGVAEYLVQEVQKVYKAQGISIHDKHIEVIVRQMLRKRRVKGRPGDTDIMPGKLVDISTFYGQQRERQSERIDAGHCGLRVARHHRSGSGHRVVLVGGELPEDDQSPDRSGHAWPRGLPGRSEGERDYWAPDSGGHGACSVKNEIAVDEDPDCRRIRSGQRRTDARRRVARAPRRRARPSTWTTCLACPVWAPKTTNWRAAGMSLDEGNGSGAGVLDDDSEPSGDDLDDADLTDNDADDLLKEIAGDDDED